MAEQDLPTLVDPFALGVGHGRRTVRHPSAGSAGAVAMDGVTDDSAAWAGLSPSVDYDIPAGTSIIGSDTTITAGALNPHVGSVLQVAAGATLTLEVGHIPLVGFPWLDVSAAGAAVVLTQREARPEWFGATGEIADDATAALEACYAAIPDGGTMKLKRAYRFTSKISWHRNIDVIGAGWGTALIPDLNDPLTDGIVVNDAVADLYRLRLDRFSVLSDTADCCKDALVLNRVHVSEINVHVKAKCAGWGTVFKGCLINRKARVVTSVNYPYPYPAGMPVLGSVKIDKSASGIPCNANTFDVTIEGGAKGVRGEDQVSQGNNVFVGTIEGTADQPFYMKAAKGLALRDLHLEDNQGTLELDGCIDPHIGPSVEVVGTTYPGDVVLTGCFSAVVDGLACDTLTVGATCKRTTLRQVSHSATGGIFDLSGEAIYEGPIRDGASAAVADMGGGALDPHVINEGGTFEYWPSGDSSQPHGWTLIGSAPTWQKVGDGLADTSRHYSRFAAKVTTADAAHAPAIALPWDIVAGHWVVASVWIDSPTGQPDIELQCWLGGGASVLSGQSTSVKDAWVHLQSIFYMDPAQASASIVIKGAAAGTFYVADVTVMLGVTGVAGYVAPRNAHESLHLNGRRMSYAAAKPTAGTYRQGDVVLNTAPSVVGAGGSQYVVHGWQRITDGAAHVLNTDWVELRTPTGT